MPTANSQAPIDIVVIAVGAWPASMLAKSPIRASGAVIHLCEPDATKLAGALQVANATWLAIIDLDETSAQTLLAAGREVSPNISLAILSERPQPDVCDRWFHRGARVFLESTTEPNRLAQCLKASGDLGVVIITRSVQEVVEADQILLSRERLAAGTAMTPLELRILRQLTAGLTNEEIARNISMAPRTLESHLTIMYRKLAVRPNTSGRQSPTPRCLGRSVPAAANRTKVTERKRHSTMPGA